ncbi:hypothetical protein B0J18DRAFT_199573 [Chaetomium sp. MPI-SDFR-AT-0129]|nr:hypothetical protein B0J18DRAFT_199573 [Chaetomium sp. MPI-SDFR-AT-0129]
MRLRRLVCTVIPVLAFVTANGWRTRVSLTPPFPGLPSLAYPGRLIRWLTLPGYPSPWASRGPFGFVTPTPGPTLLYPSEPRRPVRVSLAARATPIFRSEECGCGASESVQRRNGSPWTLHLINQAEGQARTRTPTTSIVSGRQLTSSNSTARRWCIFLSPAI